jgi:very-short-patch-repair endonuclease
MKRVELREVHARFRSQHALVTRAELRLLGVTAEQERQRVASGEWELAAPGVIRLAGSVRSPEQALLAACLAGGVTAVASHQSAAWLWDLVDRVPDRHAITVARGTKTQLRDVDVHHPVDYPAHVVTLRHVPCTNPLRALVDLAAVSSAGTLDAAVDRALAHKLLTVEAIQAEMERLSRPGRRGVGKMRAALRRRGFVGAPHPSVLESRTLALLRRHQIEPISTEVRMGPDGRYRIDVLIALGVLMEVDGFAYHSDPEQVAEDKRRRNRIRLEGVILLDYTWRDITYDGRRVVAEVRRARADRAAVTGDAAVTG